jgi:hypothetical protein
VTREEWLKTRWEFLRRDPEYIAAWDEISTLREKMKIAPRDEWTAGAEKEFETTMRFGLRRMIDPNKPFGEYGMKINALARYYFSSYEGRGEPTVISLDVEAINHSQDGARLRIDIDFDRVNSITALKELILKIIDQSWKSVNKGKIKVSATDYDKILEYGELRAQGKSVAQIAALKFPDAFVDPGTLDDNDPDPDQDPENKKDLVEYFLKRFDELIHGGWRRMTYP